MIDREQARQEAARRDKERLQGPWTFLAGRREADLSVNGERFVMRFRNGEVDIVQRLSPADSMVIRTGGFKPYFALGPQAQSAGYRGDPMGSTDFRLDLSRWESRWRGAAWD